MVGDRAAQGLYPLARGVVLGTIAAQSIGGTLEGLLFGLTATDMLTTVVVIGTLTAVGLAATVGLSWRATRIDPVHVLRRG